MKTSTKTICAIAASLLMSLPATAQQTTVPLAVGETALAYAQRIDVCGGANLLGATFLQGQTLVQARCASAGLGMGAPGAAAAAGGALAVLVVALASDSSSTTTTP